MLSGRRDFTIFALFFGRLFFSRYFFFFLFLSLRLELFAPLHQNVVNLINAERRAKSKNSMPYE